MEISYKITQGPQSSITLPIVSSEIEGTLIIKGLCCTNLSLKAYSTI